MYADPQILKHYNYEATTSLADKDNSEAQRNESLSNEAKLLFTGEKASIGQFRGSGMRLCARIYFDERPSWSSSIRIELRLSSANMANTWSPVRRCRIRWPEYSLVETFMGLPRHQPGALLGLYPLCFKGVFRARGSKAGSWGIILRWCLGWIKPGYSQQPQRRKQISPGEEYSPARSSMVRFFDNITKLLWPFLRVRRHNSVLTNWLHTSQIQNHKFKAWKGHMSKRITSNISTTRPH